MWILVCSMEEFNFDQSYLEIDFFFCFLLNLVKANASFNYYKEFHNFYFGIYLFIYQYIFLFVLLLLFQSTFTLNVCSEFKSLFLSDNLPINLTKIVCKYYIKCPQHNVNSFVTEKLMMLQPILPKSRLTCRLFFMGSFGYGNGNGTPNKPNYRQHYRRYLPTGRRIHTPKLLFQ